MARVYLETSFVSACVTTRTSVRSQYERAVSLEWRLRDSSHHELFVSDEVINELSNPAYPRRNEALRVLEFVPVIAVTEEMLDFAQILVDRKVMPKPIAGDALHVAVAVLSEMDVILTWNVRHLANPNKLLHLEAVCREHDFAAPRILRPDDFVELEP